MSYFIWIPFAIILYIIHGWLSYKTNSGKHSSHYIAYIILSALVFWPFVARYSKNLIFDGLLFDVIMTVSYTMSVIYFSGFKMNLYQWLGLILAFVGLFLFKKA